MNQLTKKQQKIYNWLSNYRGYIKKGEKWINGQYSKIENNFNSKDINLALKQARIDFKDSYNGNNTKTLKTTKSVLKGLKSPNYELLPKKTFKDTPWGKMIEKYKKIPKIKRLFFDIETSPNIVSTWNIGYNLTISHDNIIKERSIICICWKWEGDNTVYELHWDNGNDSKMIHKFYSILLSADEVVGHNGDKYDIAWFRTRCLFHGIETMPDIKSIDTLKISRSKFRFNSNRLDYISKFLGFEGKIKTEFSLWKKVMDNDQNALQEMIDYCKGDVTILENVYNKLNGYIKPKTHIGVLNGGNKCDCPKCGSSDVYSNGNVYLASGLIKKKMHCLKCSTYYTVSQSIFDNKDKDK